MTVNQQGSDAQPAWWCSVTPWRGVAVHSLGRCGQASEARVTAQRRRRRDSYRRLIGSWSGSGAGSSEGADGGAVSLAGPGAASRAAGSLDGSARPPNPSASPGPLPAEFASSLPQPANASKAQAAIVTTRSLKRHLLCVAPFTRRARFVQPYPISIPASWRSPDVPRGSVASSWPVHADPGRASCRPTPCGTAQPQTRGPSPSVA